MSFTERMRGINVCKTVCRFVEANQLLFSVETRKKAQVAKSFQGFRESDFEWDEFFDDFELVEDLQGTVKKL